jgi:AhpD family alkylhydroperoxidase
MKSARMKNPAMIIPNAMEPLLAIAGISKKSPVPERTLHLVHLLASQINGCIFCIDMHVTDARKAGDTDERLFALAAWREAPYFTDAERVAFALTEAVTRLSEESDAVPDSLWDEAKRHYDEPALASLLLNIALVNFWNRMNVPTRQLPGMYR